MQAVPLLDDQKSVPNDTEKSMVQMSEMPVSPGGPEGSEQEPDKLNSQEKLKAHYMDFSKEFQKDNADKCPLIGYNLHWIYQ